MGGGHAQAALESKEGAERGREDFAKGITTNPFQQWGNDYIRHSAWARMVEILTCRRDHGRSVCCSEHDHHLGGMRTSQFSLTWCMACEESVKPELERRKALHALTTKEN